MGLFNSANFFISPTKCWSWISIKTGTANECRKTLFKQSYGDKKEWV